MVDLSRPRLQLSSPKTSNAMAADGSRVYDQELKLQQEINDTLIKQSGTENQYELHQEMGKWMTDNVTVVRYNDKLKATDDKLLELHGSLQTDLN